MGAYFLRRLLLIPPTLLGVTVLVFCMTRLLPGGPLEQALLQAQQVDQASGFAGGGAEQALSDEQIKSLEALYGYDKPLHIAYLDWLGNLLQGDLGNSFRFQLPVMTLIGERIPISLFFGVISMILTYGVCIPLGIVKAIKHQTWIDNTSSILVFAGYAVPSYALGAILLLLFSVQLDWFPLTGFTSDNFAELSLLGKAGDIIWHGTLPLMCYLVGSFAVTTLLMKNHLLENLAADFMRTAVAKGLSRSQAIWRHALRNSLIPIATTFGQNITLVISGSFLVEFVFDINGMGLLGLESIQQRDYPVVMGIVFISALLLLLGNVLSDLIVAVVDPRIRFE